MTRGEVYRVKLKRARGHVQRGPRLGVIVQADEFLGLSTAIVAPTSQSALAASFRPSIIVRGERTRVLVEQLRAVDIAVLDERVGHLSPSEQAAVDDALELVLGLR